jgi:hypothetical protein
MINDKSVRAIHLKLTLAPPQDKLDGDDFRPITRAQRYIFDTQFEDLDESVKARYKELKSKDCKEKQKENKIRALINAAVSRTATAKTGGVVATYVTPQLKRQLVSSRVQFNSTWSEGEPIKIAKHRLGDELYSELVAEGDIKEDGRMCYIKKERRDGVSNSLANTKQMEKTADVKDGDWVTFTKQLANESFDNMSMVSGSSGSADGTQIQLARKPLLSIDVALSRCQDSS